MYLYMNAQVLNRSTLHLKYKHVVSQTIKMLFVS